MSLNFDRKHPYHVDNAAHWAKLHAAHEGKGVNDYLNKHPMENAKDFELRKKGALAYRNYPKLAVDLWLSNLLKKPPARTLPDAMAELVPDMDRLGTPASLIFKELGGLALLYGASFALVDLPKMPPGTKPQTVADAQALGIRPYLTPLTPLDVIDWAVNPDGSLAWVVIAEQIDPPALPFAESKPQPARLALYPETWELWTKDKSGKLEMVEAGTHPFGEVPVIPFYAERVGPMMGKSPVAGIVDLSLELLGLQSILGMSLGYSAIPRYVTFSRATAGSLPLDRRTVGWHLDPGDDAKYLYLPSDATKALQTEAANLKADIRALTYRQTDQRKESAQRESADAKRLDMSALHASLASWAKNFEEAELKCWQLLCRGMPQRVEESGVSITWNKKFDLRTAEERLREAMEVEALDLPSPTFRREYRSQLVKALLEDAAPEVVTQAVAELEQAAQGEG